MENSKILELDEDAYAHWLNIRVLPQRKYIVDNTGDNLLVFLLAKEPSSNDSLHMSVPNLPDLPKKSMVSQFINQLEKKKPLERKPTPVPKFKVTNMVKGDDMKNSQVFQKTWDLLDEVKEQEILKTKSHEKIIQKTLIEKQVTLPPTPRTPQPTRERIADYTLSFPLDLAGYDLLKMKLLEGKLPNFDQFETMVLAVTDLLKSEKSLNSIVIPKDGSLVVVGDLHGQLFDYLTLMDLNGLPTTNKTFLFNGDFVDRGHHSIEIVLFLYCLKLVFPNSVFFNKGNHENVEMNAKYGFKTEAIQKYGSKMYELIQTSFDWLSYATLIDDKYLVVHGGLTEYDDVTLEEIASLPRPQYTIKDVRPKAIARQLLWSDPVDTDILFEKSERGLGYFGETR
jgi:serine/threonine-protein phosphatase 5